MTTSSNFNKSIILEEFQGAFSLIVNGIQQTGEYVNSLYKQAFSVFPLHIKKDAKVLVLGVGGGSVIHTCLKSEPSCNITGIDIDSNIIYIAKKYFNLDLACIQFIVQDAKTYVLHTSEYYDVVIVDLFIGNDIPEFVEQKKFLSDVYSIMNKGGKLLINFQRMEEYEKRAEILQNNLQATFSVIRTHPIRRNYFYYAQK